MKRAAAVLVVFTLIGAGATHAQFRSDTSIVFKPSNPNFLSTSSRYSVTTHAWGFDLSLSNNGFAAGLFLRREFTEQIAGTLTFSMSDVKAEGEYEYFDVYGQSYVPEKVNRLLLMPLLASIQYRLFEDDITETFRPFVSAGLGPCMVFVSPYSRSYVDTLANNLVYSHSDVIDFFTSLKSGRPEYTVGGYIGAGAHFGLDRSTLTGLSMRYMFVPFPNGIEVLTKRFVKDVGGFYITLHFGSFY